MRVPVSWLRELVRFDLDVADLCERLTMGGLEVESVERMGGELSGVVVARIEAVEPHPDASRLSLCRVVAGDGSKATVVCGATNMRAGDLVPWARPGAVLPGGRRIEAAVIRGQRSEGMLCSGAEIGASEDAAGLLILPRRTPLGADVGDVLGLRETVIEIGVTPNRGDCLSVLGVAREVVALAGGRLVRRRTRLREGGPPARQRFSVEIHDPDGCRRYAARVVRGVRVGPSPLTVQQRLRAAGLRPISNVVDATNYVMLERGQPLHAFDAARLPGSRIGVRRARPGERIRTLDGVERALSPEDLLITAGDVAVAIAGVMGGAETEVREDTTELLLEAAWFDPASVRRTARRLEIPSEASYRFERGTDIEGILPALDRVAALIAAWAGGEVAPGVVDACPRPHVPVTICARPRRISALLGLDLPRRETAALLRRVGAVARATAGGRLAVTVPSYRRDLAGEIDLVEEVARVAGYDRIPATMPRSRLEYGAQPLMHRAASLAASLLAGQGLHETIAMTFASPEENTRFPGFGLPAGVVRIVNPLTKEQSELRRSLLGGLLAAARVNRNAGLPGAALFTVGKVFGRAGVQAGPEERWRLGAVVDRRVPHGWIGRRRAPDFYDIKGIVELLLERFSLLEDAGWERPREEAFLHPGKSARVLLGGTLAGFAGTLHPETAALLDLEDGAWFFELDLEALAAGLSRERSFRPLPRYPAVVRDIALLVDADLPAASILHVVRRQAHPLVESVELFDEYRGEQVPPGKKSLAWSISYRAADRTLTDEEVNRVHDELVAAVLEATGAELR